MSENQKFIFSSRYAIEALKSTAYNNSAYALSEIVDNSYEAGAQDIHIAIICKKDSNSPDFIAVLDNGKGMNNDEMQCAISYGDGSHAGEDPNKIKGLGRFGVGLLSATFNQCMSLEIWSWQNGLHVSTEGYGVTAPKISLSIPKIDELKNIVPEPKPTIVPEFFEKVFSSFPDIESNPLQGTLLVWRDFHNLSWRKADTLRRHLAFDCGRIYRNFIASTDKPLKIVISLWDSNHQMIDAPIAVGVVDPMFLQPWNSKNLVSSDKYGLGPFEGKPMFEPHSEIDGDNRLSETGDAMGETMVVQDGDVYGKILILASRRSPAVLKTVEEFSTKYDPGSTPYGRMAKRLEGVSILRASREIMLDTRWLSDQTVDRWISVSINFDPCLDKYFGVSNNKQQANYLADLARFSTLRQEDDMASLARNEVVLKVAGKIHDLLRKMRKYVQSERIGVRAERGGKGRTTPQTPEYETPDKLKLLTKQIEPWSNYHPIRSDKGAPSHDELKKGYDGSFWGGKPAGKVRPFIVMNEKLRVDYVSEPSGGGAFFSVRETPSVMIIKLNRDHSMYDRLSEILGAPNEGAFNKDASNKDASNKDASNDKEHSWEIHADQAVWLIKRLLFCYARAECEAQGRKKEEFESVRLDWGRIASVVMEDE